jgi:hypothetical protein
MRPLICPFLPQRAFARSAAALRLRRAAMLAALAAPALLAQLDLVRAQSAPDSENGRFTLSPVAEGFLRLDTRTGAVSTCSNKGGWACRLVPDERAALDAEIGRLQADNKKLREQLAQRETVTGKTDAPLPKEDRKDLDRRSAQAEPGGKTIELQLPADHQKLMALLDRVWEQLVEMASRVQKKLSEKI